MMLDSVLVSLLELFLIFYIKHDRILFIEFGMNTEGTWGIIQQVLVNVLTMRFRVGKMNLRLRLLKRFLHLFIGVSFDVGMIDKFLPREPPIRIELKAAVQKI